MTNSIGVKSTDASSRGLLGLGNRSTLAIHPAAAIATRKWSSTAPQPSSASLPEWSVAYRTRSLSSIELDDVALEYPTPGLAVVQRRRAAGQCQRLFDYFGIDHGVSHIASLLARTSVVAGSMVPTWGP